MTETADATNDATNASTENGPAPEGENAANGGGGGAAADDDANKKLYETEESKSIESPPSSAECNSELTMSQKWSNLVLHVHRPILQVIQMVTQLAARNPRWTIASVSLLSFTLIILGFATNFNVDVDENKLWTPFGSLPIQHMDYINDDTSFSAIDPHATFFFHEDGKNVLGHAQVARIFEILQGVQSLPSYDKICSQDSYVDPYENENKNACEIGCVTRFWNNSAALFDETPATDEAVIEILSQNEFPEGTPVKDDMLYGKPVRDSSGDLLTEAQLYYCLFALPDLEDDSQRELEKEIIDYALEKRDEWANDENGFVFRPEIATMRSFSDEFERAILKDLPLVPIVFIVMSVFTSLFFARGHPIYSRSLLGFSAVVSVLLSIMSGFGLMFCCGVPFTSMSQLLPFVMFGIGLDDAFIIMGSYSRTDPKDGDALHRIKTSINDIGIAISLTSLTSTLAFGIGCISTIPSVFWLCLYAFPTVMFVYAYQLTFFIACIVLDEGRIEQKRRDCCVCLTVQTNKEDEVYLEESPANESSELAIENKRQELYESWMRTYARFLLLPWVKAVVIAGFLAFGGLCAWSTSKLSQEFSFTEVVPSDSYLIETADVIEDYGGQTIFAPYIYFRNVDQGNSTVQEQMIDYVNEFVSMDAVSKPPDFFWLLDFRDFVNSTGIEDQPFESQMDAFLADENYYDLYREVIERDDSGDVKVSRVHVRMLNVDEKDIHQQVDVLFEQREISENAPANIGQSEFAFFSYEESYNIWEFYSVAVDELKLTTIIGVAVMSGIALVFVPHWTAVLFVAPTISLLYVDLLGILQWGGVHINAVMYICLVISIGLLVDFVLHMTIRYYECEGNRHEKTVRMLETMGVSILVGGVSTFLGTLPLAFSTSSIFHTVFLAFLTLVLMGMAHSLMLLPVILSIIGPEDRVSHVTELQITQSSQSKSVWLDELSSEK